jgi:hypothetical protein
MFTVTHSDAPATADEIVSVLCAALLGADSARLKAQFAEVDLVAQTQVVRHIERALSVGDVADREQLKQRARMEAALARLIYAMPNRTRSPNESGRASEVLFGDPSDCRDVLS